MITRVTKGIIFVWDRCIMLLLCMNQYLSSCLCTHIHWRTHKPLDRKVRLTELCLDVCTSSLAGNDQLTMAWQWLLKHSRPSTPYQSTNKHIKQYIFIYPQWSSSPSSQSLSTVSRCPNPILRFQFAAAKTLLKSIQIPFTESTWNLSSSYFSRSISWMAREIFSPTSCFQYMLWVIRSLAWRNILRTR